MPIIKCGCTGGVYWVCSSFLIFARLNFLFLCFVVCHPFDTLVSEFCLRWFAVQLSCFVGSTFAFELGHFFVGIYLVYLSHIGLRRDALNIACTWQHVPNSPLAWEKRANTHWNSKVYFLLTCKLRCLPRDRYFGTLIFWFHEKHVYYSRVTVAAVQLWDGDGNGEKEHSNEHMPSSLLLLFLLLLQRVLIVWALWYCYDKFLVIASSLYRCFAFHIRLM